MRALSEIIQSAKHKGFGFVRALFYIPKHGKLLEVTFLGRIALSITVIVGCLSAMALSAYAYFRADEMLVFGELSSADYALEITVDGEPLSDGKLQGAAGETHTVTLKKGGSAKTGFCVITVKREGAADVVYHTQQIGADHKVDGDWTEQITFEVKFDGAATLEFAPHWGTSSSYSYRGYEAFEQEPKDNLYLIDREILTVAADSSQSAGTTTSGITQTTMTTKATATTVTTVAATSTTGASDESPSTSATDVTEGTTVQTEESSLTTSTSETTTETTEVNTTVNEEN